MSEKTRTKPRLKIRPSWRRNSSDPPTEESSEGDESAGFDLLKVPKVSGGRDRQFYKIVTTSGF